MQLQDYGRPLIHNSAPGDVLGVDSLLLLEWLACFSNMQAFLMHLMLNNKLSCICMHAGIIFLLC